MSASMNAATLFGDTEMQPIPKDDKQWVLALIQEAQEEQATNPKSPGELTKAQKRWETS